jgi:sigma-B regulation protein RsbU (phosphoserine phosphatase)
MQIRSKLLILLLVIALVPLGFSAVLNQFGLQRLGDRLTNDTRLLLENSAQQLLLSKVADYRRILQRDQQTLQLALDSQARGVEQLLAASFPKSAPIYFAASYDHLEPKPPGLQPSKWHFRFVQEDTFEPMLISYQEQVVLLVEKRNEQLNADLARISHLTDVYRQINQIRPNLFFWQYTALETGIHSSYPGHGGYPAGFDPRKRSWYLEALQRHTQIRKVVTDATTGKPILTLSQPVYRPDGSFAGVTAIDVAYEQLFADWEIPEDWREDSEKLVARLSSVTPEKVTVEILLRAHQKGASADWQRPPEQQTLESPDHEPLFALQQDVLDGRSGVREMRWQGVNSLVAYSPGITEEPFPLVVVPVSLLSAPAVKVENYLRGKIVSALEISGLLLLIVFVWVVLTAYFRSRSVTLPVKVLASAANRLAEGDYSVKVKIDTGDELQSLGDTFNKVGPQLQERETLKQSMLVAREIQQRLLPADAPFLQGFDIAGKTRYCDETGGDYFDYITIDIQRLALVVGDVTGHGIGPTLLMSAARSVLRSQTTPDLRDAGDLLAHLNRHLEQDTADNLFMTLFYGILDADARIFSWVSAGHGPAFHYHRSIEHFEELASTGIPLGILADATFGGSGPNMVETGDILVIGTDGIWESRSADGQMFGIERMQEVVANNATKSAEEIISAVFLAAESFRGELALEDDLTLLVVKG